MLLHRLAVETVGTLVVKMLVVKMLAYTSSKDARFEKEGKGALLSGS